MNLEISRITDCASWHTVVGMEYSTVFDKYQYPVNWVEPMIYMEIIFYFGGSGEIRTHERFPVAGFQDRCNRPLCHASVKVNLKGD